MPSGRGNPNDENFRRMVKADRSRFLKMPKQEKRKLYKRARVNQGGECGKQEFLQWYELADIKPWSEVAPFQKTMARFQISDEINQKVSLFKQDITRLEIDGIVNAANIRLLGGSGIDGAIHKAAGPLLLNECKTLGGAKTGDAKTTAGYNLPAKYIIHAVGPDIRNGDDKRLLKCAYESCLREMKKHCIKSIAFPCISVGVFKYPKHEAVHVALNTVRRFLEEDDYAKEVQRIIFCVYSDEDLQVYEDNMPDYFPTSKFSNEASNECRQSDLEKTESRKRRSDDNGTARRGKKTKHIDETEKDDIEMEDEGYGDSGNLSEDEEEEPKQTRAKWNLDQRSVHMAHQKPSISSQEGFTKQGSGRMKEEARTKWNLDERSIHMASQKPSSECADSSESEDDLAKQGPGPIPMKEREHTILESQKRGEASRRERTENKEERLCQPCNPYPDQKLVIKEQVPPCCCYKFHCYDKVKTDCDPCKKADPCKSSKKSCGQRTQVCIETIPPCCCYEEHCYDLIGQRRQREKGAKNQCTQRKHSCSRSPKRQQSGCRTKKRTTCVQEKPVCREKEAPCCCYIEHDYDKLENECDIGCQEHGKKPVKKECSSQCMVKAEQTPPCDCYKHDRYDKICENERIIQEYKNNLYCYQKQQCEKKLKARCGVKQRKPKCERAQSCRR